MSETRISLEAATAIVRELADKLRHACERLAVGGSIRRERPDVKDAELVAISRGRDLHTLTDKLVQHGVISKATYGSSISTRWGDQYRGMVYKGLKIEIFMCDADSWGNQFWLRTGPGEANTFVMKFLAWQNAPVRFQDGYVWYSAQGWQKGWRGKNEVWVAADRRKLRIAEEEDLFAVLGMPFIPAPLRSETKYRLLLGAHDHRWGDCRQYLAPLPVQATFVSARYSGESDVAVDYQGLAREGERAYWATFKPTARMLWNRRLREQWQPAQAAVAALGLPTMPVFETNDGPRRGDSYLHARLCLPCCGERARLM